jgi:riboflavin kinase/FMN adenylyltransferase
LNIYYSTDNLKIEKPVVTVGIFDGVHKGHKYIINKLFEISGKMNGSPVIVTLWPHPRHILNHNSDETKLITTFEEKIRILSELGVKNLVVKDFTIEFSRMTACEFIENVLVGEVGIHHLVFGYNHRFGSDHEGDIMKIKKCAEKFGFTAEQLERYSEGENKISSSEIRKALLKGDVKSAEKMLGHNFFISGSVTGGSRVGRSIGFPTANILPGHFLKILPRDGVYAVEVETGYGWFRGMLNIGIRPTVNDNPDHKTIEVHIIDFNKDIYGKQIHLHFVERIREEMKFQSIEELKEQLIKDRITVMDILKGHTGIPNQLRMSNNTGQL